MPSTDPPKNVKYVDQGTQTSPPLSPRRALSQAEVQDRMFALISSRRSSAKHGKAKVTTGDGSDSDESRLPAPPPTIVSSDHGDVGHEPVLNEQHNGSTTEEDPSIAGDVASNDLPASQGGVSEGSKWAEEVQQTMERAFKMLKQLVDDDCKEDPTRLRTDHLLQRVREMRGNSGEMNHVLELLEMRARLDETTAVLKRSQLQED